MGGSSSSRADKSAKGYFSRIRILIPPNVELFFTYAKREKKGDPSFSLFSGGSLSPVGVMKG